MLITQYYTSGTYRPVREIAEASKTGPATTIISGMAVGFENTALPVLVICASRSALSYYLGTLAAICRRQRLVSIGGIYGTAVATMGMLMSAGYILAMDTFGPITDNAGGIVEMSGAPESVRDDHRRAGRRGQHDQGADQGLWRRLGGAGGFPAL